MNAHVIVVFTTNFKRDDIRGLLLVKVLSEYVGTLSVSLAPLVCFSVEKLKAEYTLSELVHDVGPQQIVNLRLLPSKKTVNIG